MSPESVSYLLSGLLGAAVGFWEVLSSFENTPREAFARFWTWALILFNGLLAALAQVAALTFWNPELDPRWVAVAVGLGLNTVIRTRFTFARQLAEGGKDLGLDAGAFYDRFQAFCKRKIDRSLLPKRMALVERVLERYPDLREMERLARYVVLGLQKLDEETRAQKEAVILQAMDRQRLPPEQARVKLALFVIDEAGPDYVTQVLLRTPVDQAPAVSDSQLVARLLNRHPAVADLQREAESAIRDATGLSGEEREEALRYLRESLIGNPALSDEDRRLGLGWLIVNKAGRSYAMGLLGAGGSGHPGAH